MQQLEINAKEMDMQVEELELHEANVESIIRFFSLILLVIINIFHLIKR